jgi:hypothetical protein
MAPDHPFRANARRPITSEDARANTGATPGIPSARLSQGVTDLPTSRTPENRPLYFQSFAHCPLSLTSFFALCFDTLAHSSSRNSPVLIVMHHCPSIFSPDYVASAAIQRRRRPRPARAAADAVLYLPVQGTPLP